MYFFTFCLVDDIHDEYEFDEGDYDEGAPANKKRKVSNTVRVKWTSSEETEIRRFFKRNLETGVTPGKSECERAIDKSKANNGLIHRRNWETLKKKVWNMISKM